MAVLHAPETVNVTACVSMAETWRAKMHNANAPSPIDRDRDQKLLLWAEYAETFRDRTYGHRILVQSDAEVYASL